MRGTTRRAVLITLLLVTGTVGVYAQTSEYRAMWISRFEWPLAHEGDCKDRIFIMMTSLANANFNAVFFQVRGQADTLYPSPYEVWSPLLGGGDPGWDPLQYAIDTAHNAGLEFHAYINTHTCWWNDEGQLPADPNHMLYKHCLASDPAARDWLHHTNPYYPAQFNKNYVWIAPGVPAYQAYLRQQVMYVVENYDIDGVHFDRIRTPGVQLPSMDPISRERQYNQWTNPEGMDMWAWTTDQITRTTCDLRAAIMSIKPEIKISAAVLGEPYYGHYYTHQDAPGWAHAGAMDLVVPMMYYEGGQGSGWDSDLQWWLGELAGADAYVMPGIYAPLGYDTLVAQTEVARLRGAAGNSVFSVSSFAWWDYYEQGIYSQPASLPALPWKDNPSLGIIYGYITAPDGSPVTDARVEWSGQQFISLSSADGFYSMLKVTPGTHTVTASHPGYLSVSAPGVSVSAGQVVRQDIAFEIAPPPGDYNDDFVVDQADLIWMMFCLGGPDETYNLDHFCVDGDADADWDVDILDFRAFQLLYMN